MKRQQSLMGYGLIILLSLFVILFVGSKFDAETNTSSLVLTSSGWSEFRKGMDVAGGVRLYYKIDLSKYEQIYTNPQELNEVVRNVQNIILSNIDTRVSGLGVSDYESKIQTLEDGQYVVIDLGGVHDMAQAKEIIGKTVELEFKVPYEGDGADVEVSRQLLAESLLKQAVDNPETLATIGADNASRDVFYQYLTEQPLDQLPQLYRDNIDTLDPELQGMVRPVLTQGVHTIIPAMEGFIEEEVIVEGRVVSKLIAVNESPVFDANGDTEEAQEGEEIQNTQTQTTYTLEELFVSATPTWITAQDPTSNEILNGAFFRYASVGYTQTGQPTVLVHFDDRGTQIFCNLTESLIGKQMAIYVGGVQVTAPVIQDRICQGTAQITGDFTPVGAKEIVDDLNAGALPAALILAHEEKVSATLGERAMRGALLAGSVGLVLVFIYMFVVYGVSKGFVAMITLVSFLIVLFAVVKLFGVALSLSGIAAILLSIGMGVDANVLIFERVAEELKEGKSPFFAVTEGYDRSWSAIRDGNMTTGFIALLLLVVGTNVFKGFGTMMTVNILITLLVLTPLTKYVLLWFLGASKK